MANRNSQNGLFIVLGALLAAIAAIVLIKGRNPISSVPEVKLQAAVPSQALDINIYVDGSGSIKHFLQKPPANNDGTPPPHNYVEDVFNKTENLLHNSPSTDANVWKDRPNIRLWKFGAGDPRPLNNETLQSMAADLNKFDQGNTLIEKPIDAQPHSGDDQNARPELKIILTDLYESNGQLGGPAERLADKYLKDDTEAVGVVALRNGFVGPVEDLPGSNRKTFPNAADTMPFYVIFAGPAGDVRHAMDLMVDGIGLKDALKNGKAAEFFFGRAAQTPGQDIKMSFSPTGAYSLAESATAQAVHAQFIKLHKGILTVKWSDPRRGDPAFVKIASGEKLLLKQVGPDGTPASAISTRIATPCNDVESGLDGKFCVSIDRSKMIAKITYVFEFDLVETSPADTFRSDSELMKHWNIEVPDAENISRMPAPAFPLVGGAKPGLTPSLSLFLSSLQNQMFHGQVRAASYYLFVQAD